MFSQEETVRFSERNTLKGVAVFTVDVVALSLAMRFAIVGSSLAIQSVASIAAGLIIGILFVVGHDAAHNSLTPHRWLNGLLGRLAMLPSLHAYSLWQLVHNQTHHRWTNLAPRDYVWTPLSPSEYLSMSGWQKQVYRFYRSWLGPLAYYFFEFWIKRIVFPSPKEVRGEYKPRYIIDIALVLGFAAVYLSWLTIGGARGWFRGEPSVPNALLFGFVVPFFVWNVLMGFVIYLHHTHPAIRWYDNEAEWKREANQSESAVHVVFPGPINTMFHWIMEHNAHHARPSIPLYNLPQAQDRLLEEADCTVFHWTPWAHLDVARRCKLYDFATHRWLDFEGNFTSDAKIATTEARPQLQPHIRTEVGSPTATESTAERN